MSHGGACHPGGALRDGDGDRTESTLRARKERKTPKKARGVQSCPKQTEDMQTQNKQDAETAANAAANDLVQFVGADAYLVEDTEQIQKQRQANLKIRALLSLRKGRKDNRENPFGSDGTEESQTAAAAFDAAAADDVAAAGVGAAPHSAIKERDGSLLGLSEFTALPELSEAPSLPTQAPLRPWQHQQHQQLLRLQQRQVQQHERLQKAYQQGAHSVNDAEISKERPQPWHQKRDAASAAATPGATAIAAAGAAAAAGGADFFGRLHAECLAALQMLRPSEAEEKRKREVRHRRRIDRQS